MAHQMDQILAYMWPMLREANKAEISVRRAGFQAPLGAVQHLGGNRRLGETGQVSTEE